jgi:hypothetical protein
VVVGCQTKVGELTGHTLVCYQYVLRLQVPVIDSDGMAILDSIQDLEESPLGKSIITNILSLFGDIRKEVTFGAVLNNNICAVWGVHDLGKGYHVGMGAGTMVELNFSLLEFSLTRLEAKLVQRLHSIGCVGLNV